MKSKLEILIAAIERREGFGIPGALPTRLNNPGDLMFAHQRNASPHPIVGKDGKTRTYAAFPTVADGLAALNVQIHLDAARGLSLAQFIGKYAPAADGNDETGYLSGVMRDLGVTDSAIDLWSLITTQ